MNRFRVGLCQFRTSADKTKNLAKAEAHIRTAKKAGARLVVLPEMFVCPYVTRLFPDYAETIRGTVCQTLSTLAKKLKVHIVGGSFPEKSGKNLYNTAPVFAPSGKLIAKHRKVHLFDVNVKGVRVQESRVITAGNGITVFKTPFGLFGLLICFDIRFPDMFLAMRKKGIVGVIIPGAFSVPTGLAHWETLIKARAVDFQIYVLAVSPARNSKSAFPAYGHSRVVNPWGEKMNSATTGEKIVIADLDKSFLKKIRTALPLS